MVELRVIFICLSLVLYFSSFGQKIKYKKGEVTIDKELSYRFDRTKNGMLMQLNNYSLTDLDDTEILIVRDTTIYYDQLPYETEARKVFSSYIIEAPLLSRETMVDQIKSFSLRNSIVARIEDYGFFETGELSNEIYDSLITFFGTDRVASYTEYRDSVDLLRRKNYNLMKSEFGDLPNRKPGVIRMEGMNIFEGTIKVGSFKMETRGSYAHVYNVLNNDGITIANFTIVMSENQANVRTLVNESRMTFRHQTDTVAEAKLKQAAEYLINYGYL